MLTSVVLALAIAPALDEKRPIKFPITIEDSGFQGGVFDVGACLVTGQPNEASFRRLASEGYKTVVCLRMQEELDNREWVPFDETALLKELGMKFVHIPVGDANPAAVKKFADALNGADGKVLLHCTVAWRATYMWMAYLVTDRGMSVDDAWKAGMSMNVTVDRTSLMLDRTVSYTPVPHVEGGRKPVTGVISSASSKLKITSPTAVYPPDEDDWSKFAMWDMGSVLNASQPDEAKLREIYALGVGTIVNLRTPAEMERVKESGFDEVAVAQALGMKYINVPIQGWQGFTPAALGQIATAFDAAEGRILFHCNTATRTSQAIVPYLVKFQGMDVDEAQKVGDSMRASNTLLQEFLGVDFKLSLKPKAAALPACG